MNKTHSNTTYTDIDEIINKVELDYRSDSTMLNSLYFDFNVKMQKRDLLKIYALLQQKLNGDEIVRLTDVTINDKTNHIIAKKINLFNDDEYCDIYEGNFKDFLESFNDKEKDTGLYRIIDSGYVISNNYIMGAKLDFIL